MNNRVINEFINLNFTRVEAVVYYTLVKYGELNGSQISKYCKIPRSSVYPALENLYSKGAVILLPTTEPNIYKAVNIDNLLENLQTRFSQSSEIVKEELRQIQHDESDEYFWNFKGLNHFHNKAVEFLRSAKEEVVIHYHYDFDIIKEEIRNLCNRNVRVILFSFYDIDVRDLPVEFHHSDKFGNSAYSILEVIITVDYQKVLLAYGNPDNTVHGIYTSNHYLIQTLSSYIHHDIYLLALEKKFNLNLITEEVQIQSLHERAMLKEMQKRDLSKIRDYKKYR